MAEPLPDDFFRLVERSSDLIVIVREGLLAYVNPAFAGALGYTQYFLHVPPLLVALHMLGACLVWLAALRVAFSCDTVRPSAIA